MTEQIRGHGGDDLHYLNGGKRLDAAERLPLYLCDFQPEELEPEARAARQRLLDGMPTEADQALDGPCDQCGDRHRPDFAGVSQGTSASIARFYASCSSR